MTEPCVSKTIKLNDCMKGSKKFSVNNEQIARFVKVKDHTKTWIKNVEKMAKNRNEYLTQPVINFDYPLGTTAGGDVVVKTPLEYPPRLHIPYSCSYCSRQAPEFQVQYHDTLTHQYVLRCNQCSR